MMALFWPRQAIQDREDMYEYIEADNLAAALALDELFAERRAAWSIIGLRQAWPRCCHS